jgi:hypothetical protein
MTYRPRVLSHSAVELYGRCPAAYRQRYVLGVVSPPTPLMVFGRCFSTALEALHRGGDGEVAWVRAYSAAQAIGELPLGSPTIEHGLRLLALYHARGVGVGTPEWKFEVHLPNRDAVPVPILGYLDLATDDEVWEFKTTSARWDQGRVDGSPQAALYRYAYQRVTGRKPQCVRFLVFSTRRVELSEFCAYPAGPELRLFELKAAAVWRAVSEGRFPATCKRADCPACVEAGVAAPLTVSARKDGLFTWD